MMQKMIVNHAGNKYMRVHLRRLSFCIFSAASQKENIQRVIKLHLGSCLLNSSVFYVSYSKDWLLRILLLNVFLKKENHPFRLTSSYGSMLGLLLSFFSGSIVTVGVCNVSTSSLEWFYFIFLIFFFLKKKTWNEMKQSWGEMCVFVILSLPFKMKKEETKEKQETEKNSKIIMKLKMIK